MSRRRKRETPQITVEIPHIDEDVREMIGAELVEKYFNEHLDFDTIGNDVRIIARNPSNGFITLDMSFTCTHWNALSEFLNDIRHRLVELVRDELLEYVEMHLASKQLDGGIAYTLQEAQQVIEESRMPSEENLAVSWLRDTLGLEGRERPSVSVSNIARIRLRRSDSDARKHMVRDARAVLKEIRK